MEKDIKICVIGLGYVGLPLARLFSTKYPTVGFDMNQARVDALMQGHDATLEVADDLLQDAIANHGFRCTTDIEEIRDCNFYIVAVPTPVDRNNAPDLTPLRRKPHRGQSNQDRRHRSVRIHCLSRRDRRRMYPRG